MIIKLTPAEVKGFVANVLNLSPARFEVEIVDPADAPLLAAFRQAITEFPHHASVEKIQTIRRFRDLAGKHLDRGFSVCVVGLADAKWAVENATDALTNLERTGRIRP